MTPELQEKYDRLTNKQKLFVDLWTGEQEETARLAGYKAPKRAAIRCLQNVTIRHLTKIKRDEEIKPHVMSRIERQEFWTNVIRGKEEDNIKMSDRLKASELLGKSECDFIEKIEHTGKDGESIIIFILAS